ncbi:MAG: uracil-DNA glycosylase [Clostridiales bacterium]|nr:uracil-DNA glycosylase [Clostridiales bacterium]
MNECRACGLCEGRRNVVVGRGSLSAGVLFIGEGPGENEDAQGLPFVGRAGKLLDLALEGLEFGPDAYYIANVVKCRPPGNRVPSDDEAAACLPFLRRQVRLISPAILVCLGAVAMRHIIGKEHRITKIRGEWVERGKWLIMPTFHPAALLRDDSKKAPFWHDLKTVRQRAEQIAAQAQAQTQAQAQAQALNPEQ